MKMKSNIEFHKDYIIIHINPYIYSLDVVYSASYVFLDRAYILIKGDPEKKILVELKSKQKNINLEILGREFNNELLNYSAYKSQVAKNAPIRRAIIQSLLLTNYPDILKSDSIQYNKTYLDDPEGIAIPWEEKYGKKSRIKK